VRSACAFGWERVFLDDRGDAWYECDRRIKAQSRGAARRGRNPIKVIPYYEEQLAAHNKIAVFTTSGNGVEPQRTSLTGNDVLIVLPDETTATELWSPPASWAGEIIYAALPVVPPPLYHFRQMSAIGLAEVARQVGGLPGQGVFLKRRKDRYRREVLPHETAKWLTLEDLAIF